MQVERLNIYEILSFNVGVFIQGGNFTIEISVLISHIPPTKVNFERKFGKVIQMYKLNFAKIRFKMVK